MAGFAVRLTPFRFHSGMGLRNFDREEAIVQGLEVEKIKPDTTPNLNSNPSSSVKKMAPEVKKEAPR